LSSFVCIYSAVRNWKRRGKINALNIVYVFPIKINVEHIPNVLNTRKSNENVTNLSRTQNQLRRDRVWRTRGGFFRFLETHANSIYPFRTNVDSNRCVVGLLLRPVQTVAAPLSIFRTVRVFNYQTRSAVL